MLDEYWLLLAFALSFQFVAFSNAPKNFNLIRLTFRLYQIRLYHLYFVMSECISLQLIEFI